MKFIATLNLQKSDAQNQIHHVGLVAVKFIQNSLNHSLNHLIRRSPFAKPAFHHAINN